MNLVYATAQVEGTGKLQVKTKQLAIGNRTLDDVSSFLKFNEGSIGANLRLSAGGMLGKKDLASIGAYAKVGMKLGFMPNFKIKASTEIGWEANVLFLKNEDEWYADDYELYSSTDTSSRAIVLQRRATALMAEEDTTFSSNVGTEDSAWVGNASDLAQEVYYDIAPQTVTLPDGSTLMVFVNYREEMDESNPVAVYYTRYVDGEWTEPKQINDDGTVGMYPSPRATENGAVLTWMKLSEKLEDMATCEKQVIVSSLLDGVEDISMSAFGDNGVMIAWAQNEYGGSICAAVSYDGKTFADPIVVTTEDGLLSAPQVTENNGKFLFVYQQTVTDDKIHYHLKSCQMDAGVDMAVASHTSDGILYPGAMINTSFELSNEGISQNNGVKAVISTDISGTEVIAETTLTDSLAGMISWTVPATYDGEAYYLVILPLEVTDMDLSDNAVEIGNVMRDVAILSGEYMGDDEEGTQLLIRLANQGIISSGNLTLTVQDSDSGEILAEEKLEELLSGDTRDVSLTLKRDMGEISLLATVSSDKDEMDYDNNTDLIVISQLVGIQTETEETPGTEETPSTEAPSTEKPETEHVHAFGEYVETKAPTALAEGIKTRSCQGCGHKETASIAKLKPTIKLNAKTIPLKVKQSTTAVKVSGLAEGDYVVSWKSDNTKVVKVTKKGKITAKKVGTAKITVKAGKKKLR